MRASIRGPRAFLYLRELDESTREQLTLDRVFRQLRPHLRTLSEEELDFGVDELTVLEHLQARLSLV